jgi:glycerophosphoryl diester phosphodiesterase
MGDLRVTYGEGSAPLAVAHRGGGGLAQENSLVAFRLASALGLRYLETDVWVTLDGQLVCFHDDTLERATSATGLGGLVKFLQFHKRDDALDSTGG